MDYEIVTLDEKFVAGVQTVTNNSAADMQSKSVDCGKNFIQELRSL